MSDTILMPLFPLTNQFQTKNGGLNVGGYLRVLYAARTDVLPPTYKDSDGISRNTEWIELDNNARAQVYVDTQFAYNLFVYGKDKNLLWSQYNLLPDSINEINVTGMQWVFTSDGITGDGLQSNPLGINQDYIRDSIHHDATLSGDGSTETPLGLSNAFQLFNENHDNMILINTYQPGIVVTGKDTNGKQEQALLQPNVITNTEWLDNKEYSQTLGGGGLYIQRTEWDDAWTSGASYSVVVTPEDVLLAGYDREDVSLTSLNDTVKTYSADWSSRKPVVTNDTQVTGDGTPAKPIGLNKTIRLEDNNKAVILGNGKLETQSASVDGTHTNYSNWLPGSFETNSYNNDIWYASNLNNGRLDVVTLKKSDQTGSWLGSGVSITSGDVAVLAPGKTVASLTAVATGLKNNDDNDLYWHQTLNNSINAEGGRITNEIAAREAADEALSAAIDNYSVKHDETLSGNGTTESPLGVIGGGTGGKTYEGVDPIVVNNDENKISADTYTVEFDESFTTTTAGDVVTVGIDTSKISGFMEESLLEYDGDKISAYNGSAFVGQGGFMEESLLEYDGDKISAYNGSAFVGQGGITNPEYNLVNGSHINFVYDDTAKTVEVDAFGFQDPLTNAQLSAISSVSSVRNTLTSYSANWNNSRNWVTANSARTTAVNNIVTSTSATWNNKEDKIEFGYNDGKIVSINSSALSAGSNYEGVSPIQVDNTTKKISAMTKPVTMQTFTHDDSLKHTEENGVYTLGVNDGLYFPLTGGNLNGMIAASGAGATSTAQTAPIYAKMTSNQTNRVGIMTNGSIFAGDYKNPTSHTIGIRRQVGTSALAGRFQLYSDGNVSFQQVSNNGTSDSINCQLQYGVTTAGNNWGTMTFGSETKHIAYTEDLQNETVLWEGARSSTCTLTENASNFGALKLYIPSILDTGVQVCVMLENIKNGTFDIVFSRGNNQPCIIFAQISVLDNTITVDRTKGILFESYDAISPIYRHNNADDMNVFTKIVGINRKENV